MDEKMFEVEVTCRQRTVYHVRAADAESAEKAATARWKAGEAGDVRGVDGVELVRVQAAPAADEDRRRQDEALILRFVQERERLLLELGGRILGASINDAISAAQAAADLGWVRAGGESTTVDVVRAAQALERLCAARRLVCFPRSRVRADERGEIRLYCTPEYLDSLSASLEAPVTQRAHRRASGRSARRAVRTEA